MRTNRLYSLSGLNAVYLYIANKDTTMNNTHIWELENPIQFSQDFSPPPRLKDFPKRLLSLLRKRGYETARQIEAFLYPSLAALHDPFEMKDMAKAVQRLCHAREKNEQILVFGDYDVDGTSAVSFICLFFEECGFQYDYYLPDRYQEGYGLSYLGINYAEEIGASLIITLDCGIKAMDQVRYAHQKGIEVIICDHHKTGNELPAALAILNPRQMDCNYPCKVLSGCAVAFKLVEALSGIFFPLESSSDHPIFRYGDLLALSIACDIVPIKGENRIMAYFGLQKLRQSPIAGLASLMAQSTQERQWDISDLVFFIGPRINAAGRLDHAKKAVELLLGNSPSHSYLADHLHQTNEKRKRMDQEMTTQALSMIETGDQHTFSTVLFHPDWHKGIIGIVASRLIEQHYRPTILLTQSGDKLVGSARSVEGFNIYQALNQCQEHLLQFGGHKYAAGISLKEASLPAFKKAFELAVKKEIQESQRKPRLKIEQELPFASLNLHFMECLKKMAPFGPGNPRPLFFCPNVTVKQAVILKNAHVKWWFFHDGLILEAIGFFMAKKWAKLAVDSGPFDIVYQPFLDSWKGKTRIKLKIKDLKASL